MRLKKYASSKTRSLHWGGSHFACVFIEIITYVYMYIYLCMYYTPERNKNDDTYHGK